MTSQPKLFDQVRAVLRRRHYAYKTEKSYIHWIKHFIAYHRMKPPREMGAAEVEAFLTHLAVDQKVAPSTQNQALSALIFLYREVYQRDTNWKLNAERATPHRYLPTVLTQEEVQQVIRPISGVYQLVAKVLYGSGLRLNEGLRLRIKDLDYAQRQIVVRDAKGQESRVTMLPQRLVEPLNAHLQWVKRIHQQDLAQGFGAVYLPLNSLELFSDLIRFLLPTGIGLQLGRSLIHSLMVACFTTADFPVSVTRIVGSVILQEEHVPLIERRLAIPLDSVPPKLIAEVVSPGTKNEARDYEGK